MWSQCCYINRFLFPCLPEPSSPIIWPQPPQPTCVPSGLTSLQFEPVPDITTIPPMTKRQTERVTMTVMSWNPLATTASYKNTAQTIVTGSGHSANGIGGNKITLAQLGVSLPHVIDQLLDSSFLLSTTQRHTLSTHNVYNFKATRLRWICWGWLMHRLTNEQTGVSGSSPALILALWTMSLIQLMQLSTPTNYKWIEKKSYIHTQVHTSWLKYILKHVLWSHPVIGTWSICLSEDVSLSRNQYCFRVCPTAVKVENIASHSFLWSYWHFLCSNNWHEARS